MLCIGDIYIYVSDFTRALRFWADGLGLRVAEKEVTAHSAYAMLEFADGGPALRLFGEVDPWEPGTRPATGTRPTVRFDVLTTDFEAALSRALEYGGTCSEIETYDGLRSVTVADPDENTFELIEVPGQIMDA